MSKPTPEALELVKSLMALPENAICADCKKKAAKWASSTLGVFICIDCSGIHRSLGTHISFVRSCTLDSWTPEQARLMRRVGNKNGNLYWEARLPPDFSRPNSCDRASMEAFIRAKYAERRWAAPGDPPHLATGRVASGAGGGGGARPSGGMYDGYFAHNPNQQQGLQFGMMQPGRRQMSISKSTDGFPASARGRAASMNLNDFMRGLSKGSEEVESSEDVQQPEAAPQEKKPEDSKLAEPKAPALSPRSKVVVQVPQHQQSPPPPKFDAPAGSTAMDIIRQGQGQPAPAKKKQALFQKKGASRFAKKPGAPASGNVLDQMLDFSSAHARPMTAPVVQNAPANSQMGYFGLERQQMQQQQYQPPQQQHLSYRQQYPLAYPEPEETPQEPSYQQQYPLAYPETSPQQPRPY